MKRACILLGIASILPAQAWAQIPTAPPAGPTAAPAPAPAPSVAPAAAVAPAPAPGAPAASAPVPAPGGPVPPANDKPPGDQYFVDSAPAAPTPDAPAAQPVEPPPFEPPPPSMGFDEPPPPPVIHHLTPQNSLWLGARLGVFFPFGNVWAKAQPVQGSNGYRLSGVSWRDYASPGPTFELDAGMRLGRAYTLFALWERAQLGSGDVSDGPDGKQDGAETDFWAVGLRATSNPDKLGFLTEVAVGYRRARTFFKNGAEYQFTDAPFEARLGLGAELRTSRLTTFSALATIGVGGFGSAENVAPNGSASSLIRSYDEADGHAWATLSIGAHFDLIPSRN